MTSMDVNMVGFESKMLNRTIFVSRYPRMCAVYKWTLEFQIRFSHAACLRSSLTGYVFFHIMRHQFLPLTGPGGLPNQSFKSQILI